MLRIQTPETDLGVALPGSPCWLAERSVSSRIRVPELTLRSASVSLSRDSYNLDKELLKPATAAAATGTGSESNVSRTQLTEVSPVLLISTLSGELAAIEKNTGVLLWSRWENPVLKVPTGGSASSGGTGFLPDPKDGSLYILLSQDETDAGGANGEGGRSRRPFIKKLPFTIPELVTASPCRSSDGMLYTGQKLDVWFAIDLATGEKKETISFHGSDSVCPQGRAGLVYIGRSEYHLAMFDAATGERRWNATYYDYAATAANVPEVARAEYGTWSTRAEADMIRDLVHFASSEVGRIMSFEKQSGDFVWEAKFSSPIVALYLIDDVRDPHSNLRRLPFTSLAQRTMDDIGTRLLRKTWRKYLTSEWDESVLFPALYIGGAGSAHEANLPDFYALSALVDKSVSIIPCDGSERNVPLLEGPHAEDDGSNSKRRKTKGTEARELYEGYYEMPEGVTSQLMPRRQISQDVNGLMQAPSSTKKPQGGVIEVASRSTCDSESQTYPENPRSGRLLGPDERFAQQISDQLFWIKVALAMVVVILGGACFWLYPQARAYQQSSRSGSGVNLRISGETGQPVRELEMNDAGECTVGKISYSAYDRLGAGGNGTVVFRGCFEGRPVAVKRILPVCYSLAHREVQLLRETDEHPNVVRYFCMEEDPNFYYIALELCAATLSDYVENKSFNRGNPPLQPIQAMHQAASGLEHLHNLNIAHRDVKPQNLLISTATRSGQLKVMISDFGLCKKLSHGDRSFSKKSGVLGTEGWIAPEVLAGDSGSRVTKAIDVFSLGCVMYYVLSEGQHPFGETFERQANIRKGKISLSALSNSEQGLTAKGLIHQMLSLSASQRPTAAQVTHHPAFWDPTRTLNFFQEVSDRLEKESHTSPVVRSLEKGGMKVLNCTNWIDQITSELQKDLRRFRSYKGNSVRDLLRALRNKKHHYRELPPELQAELGTIPKEFVSYFTSRFPRLLLHTYAAMQHFRHDVPLLAEYYAPEVLRNPTETTKTSEPVEIGSHPDLDSAAAPDSWTIWRTNRITNHAPTKTEEQSEYPSELASQIPDNLTGTEPVDHGNKALGALFDDCLRDDVATAVEDGGDQGPAAPVLRNTNGALPSPEEENNGGTAIENKQMMVLPTAAAESRGSLDENLVIDGVAGVKVETVDVTEARPAKYVKKKHRKR
ncbi:serine/threonine-protein kinase/endoribonuclease IRE1-like [Tropilaelaps mercedesae]|uniref:non-specific serine/threonine protein kinase n=1 Tax=Tropilaelaps mercedesae TaxID=418985 RepID=A0A1V9X1P4_9ACAR|nr:serine/threonine-protein kinase/endoribonuclease IRE1-like [Tropilaelaps mercedesae]